MSGFIDIDKYFENLNEGDLVKVHLEGKNNFYVGYVWHLDREDFDDVHRKYVTSSEYTVPIFGLDRNNLFLSPISPFGIEDNNVNGKFMDSRLEYKIQMVGINTSKTLFGKSTPFMGIEILSKYNIED